MNSKLHIFKRTFTVLSIMCCLLLGSTSIIYSISGYSDILLSSRNTGLNADNKSSDTEINTTQNTANNSTVNNQDESNKNNSEQSTQNQPASDKNTSNSADATPSSDASDAAEKAQPSKPSESQNQNKSASEPVGKDTKNTPESTPATITISAVGDLMFHQGNLNNAYNPKTQTYNFTGFLEYVKPYLMKSDLTIGNFETVTAGSALGYTSYPSFNTPDAVFPALADAGFDVLSTANNHCLDRGINGLIRTIQKIQANKMSNIGSSADGGSKYTIQEVNGIKIGILAYSSFFNGNDKKLNATQQKYISKTDEKRIKSDIEAIKAKGTDAVIVFMHWGNEYMREPDSTQVSLAKKIFSWGADIILGSHPHVIQKSEIVKVNGKNKFIIYSMGNFISGYRRSDTAKRPNKIYTEDGVIVQLQLEKDLKGEINLKKVDYIPTWVDKYYVNNRPVFKIIPINGPNASESYITNKNKNNIKQSYNNTMEIMAKLK